MCLAVPVKIVSLDKKKKTGVGEIGGLKREVRLDFLPDVHPGDYVLMHAGFGIEKIKAEEAKETLELLKEMERL